MALASIQIIALIFSLLCLTKVIVVLISRKFWFRYITKSVMKARMITTIVLFILSAITFYFLIHEMSIVNIFAAMGFCFLLIATGFSMYIHEMINLGKGIVADKMTIWIIAYSLIWATISISVLIKIFCQ